MEEKIFSLTMGLWQMLNFVGVLVLAGLFLLLTLWAFRKVWLAAARKEETGSVSAEPQHGVTLAELIHVHRSRCHMTQEFVAEQLNVSRQAVSKWESGASVPSTANLLALAKLFGTDAAELLRSMNK